MSVVDPPSTPPIMDANGMIIRQDSYNQFAEVNVDYNNPALEHSAIDSYQYRLMNNYRTPFEGSYLDKIRGIIQTAKDKIRQSKSKRH